MGFKPNSWTDWRSIEDHQFLPPTDSVKGPNAVELNIQSKVHHAHLVVNVTRIKPFVKGQKEDYEEEVWESPLYDQFPELPEATLPEPERNGLSEQQRRPEGVAMDDPTASDNESVCAAAVRAVDSSPTKEGSFEEMQEPEPVLQAAASKGNPVPSMSAPEKPKNKVRTGPKRKQQKEQPVVRSRRARQVKPVNRN